MSGQTHSTPGPARQNQRPSTISQSPSTSSEAIRPPQGSISSYLATRMIFPENARHFGMSGTGQADFQEIATSSYAKILSQIQRQSQTPAVHLPMSSASSSQRAGYNHNPSHTHSTPYVPTSPSQPSAQFTSTTESSFRRSSTSSYGLMSARHGHSIETLGQRPSPSPPLTQGPLASGSYMPHGTLPSNGTHHSIGSATHPAILPTTDPSRTLMCSCAFDTPSECYVHCPLETLYSAYKALPHRDPLALQLLARVFTDPQRNYPPEIAPTEPPPANKLCLERIGIPNPCCCNSGQLSQMKHSTRHFQSNTHIREYSFEVQDTFQFEYCGNFHLCPNGYFVGRPGQVDARHRKMKKGDEYSTCRARRPVVIKGLPKAVTFPGLGTILYLPGETVPAAYADRWRFFTLSLQDEKAKCSDKKYTGTSSYNDWKTIREADLPPELRSENMSSQGTAPADNSPVVFSPLTPHISEDLVALDASASSPPLVLPSADMPSGAVSHTVPVPQVRLPTKYYPALYGDGTISRSLAYKSPSTSSMTLSPALASSATSTARGSETPVFHFESPPTNVAVPHPSTDRRGLSQAPHPVHSSHGSSLVSPAPLTDAIIVPSEFSSTVGSIPPQDIGLRPSLKRSRLEESFVPRKRSHLSGSVTIASLERVLPPPSGQDTPHDETNDDSRTSELGDAQDDTQPQPPSEDPSPAVNDSISVLHTDDQKDEATGCHVPSVESLPIIAEPVAPLSPPSPTLSCTDFEAPGSLTSASHPTTEAQEVPLNEEVTAFFKEPNLMVEAQQFSHELTMWATFMAILSDLAPECPDTVSGPSPHLASGTYTSDVASAATPAPASDAVAATSNSHHTAAAAPSAPESAPTSVTNSTSASTSASGSTITVPTPVSIPAVPARVASDLPLPRKLTYEDFLNDDLSKD